MSDQPKKPDQDTGAQGSGAAPPVPPRHSVVSNDLLQRVVNYLQGRPYAEVAGLIHEILGAARGG